MPRLLILSPTLLHSAETINPRAIRTERLIAGLGTRGFELDLGAWWGGPGAAPTPAGVRRLHANGAGEPFRLEPGADDPLGPWGEALAAELAALPRDERPELVLAIALPVGALSAGARIAAAIGVPFVADLGDPWITAGDGEEEARAQALGAAAALITTTPELAAELAPYLSEGTPVLLAPAGGELRRRAPRPEGAPPLFVHLGVLSAGRADPEPAFSALARLHGEGRIEFRSHSAGFYDRLHSLPHPHAAPLPHGEALDLLASASAALILGNRSRSQLPSKAYELSCTETWGLCVSELDDDPTARLLSAGGHGVICRNQESAIVAAAEAILAREMRGERPAPEPAHSWDRRCDQIAALLRPLAPAQPVR